jgi:hypothetical protein
VCDLTRDAAVTIWGSPRGQSAAREFVHEHVCSEHGNAALGAVLSLTSELVANAVQHGRPPVTVHLSCGTGEIYLGVKDSGPAFPGSSGAPGGVGLAIIAKISREWGVTPVPGGKEVWCRIPTGFVPARTGSRGSGQPVTSPMVSPVVSPGTLQGAPEHPLPAQPTDSVAHGHRPGVLPSPRS